MDKLGPIARSAEDCALVLNVIHGPDGQDISAHAMHFLYPPQEDLHSLRVGYLKADFDEPKPFKLEPPPTSETAEEKKQREKHEPRASPRTSAAMYDRRYELAALDKLRAMGIKLIPVELPKLPYGAMVGLLGAEAAAAFDDLTLSGRDRLLTEQGVEDWPNSFRTARFYPAVEYIQANRARTLAIQQVSALFERSISSSRRQAACSCWPPISPGIRLSSFPTDCAAAMRLARRRSIPATRTTSAVPEPRCPSPSSPGLYDDARLAAFADAYQQATGFNKVHPKLD